MDFREYVKQNETIIQFVKDVTPGEIDKYTGTLDYASARFNTILLKLSQDPLRADEHKDEVDECFRVIQNFYFDTKRYLNWPYLCKPIIKCKLHWSGVTQIPKIKFLLEKINN